MGERNVVIIKLGLGVDIQGEIMARANSPIVLGKDGNEQIAELLAEQRRKEEKEEVASAEEKEWDNRCAAALVVLRDGKPAALSRLLEASGVPSDDLRKFMIRLRKYIHAAGETREISRSTKKGEVFYLLK